MSALLAALTVVLLAAALHLPSLGAEELDDEEGRRAWPAREMLDKGDWIVPRIYGAPYLAKPPLYFWSIAAASRPQGRVDEWSTRLPAALSTIATALAVLFFTRRVASARAALLAALAFPVTLAVLEKGAFGELEAMLGLFVFLATAFLFLARHASLAMASSSGVSLGLALLVKGPPALLFFGSAVLGVLCAGDARGFLRRAAPWVALGLGMTLAGTWLLVLVQRPEWSGTAEHWRAETIGRGARDFARVVGERWDFALGVLAGFFPTAWIVVAGIGTPTGRWLARAAPWRMVLATVGFGLVFLLLAPGTRARYAYPLLPWCAVGAGLVLDRLLTTRRSSKAEDPSNRRLEIGIACVIAIVAVLGIALGGAAVLTRFRDVGGVGPLPWLPLTAALVAAVAGVLALVRLREGGLLAPLALALIVLAGARIVERTGVVPALAGHRGRAAVGARIEAYVPSGETLHIVPWGYFNEVFYVDRKVIHTPNPEGLPAGSLALFGEGGADGQGWELLGSIATYESRVVVARRSR